MLWRSPGCSTQLVMLLLTVPPCSQHEHCTPKLQCAVLPTYDLSSALSSGLQVFQEPRRKQMAMYIAGAVGVLFIIFLLLRRRQ